MSRNEPFSPGTAAAWLSLAEMISGCGRSLRVAVSEQLADEPVGESELWLLWACRKTDSSGSSQRELAATLGVSPAHISSQVEQLRRQGLLSGHRDPEDRRRQQWQITPLGEELLTRLLERLEPWARQLEARLPAGRSLDEVRVLSAVLAVTTAEDSSASSVPFAEPRTTKGAAA